MLNQLIMRHQGVLRGTIPFQSMWCFVCSVQGLNGAGANRNLQKLLKPERDDRYKKCNFH